MGPAMSATRTDRFLSFIIYNGEFTRVRVRPIYRVTLPGFFRVIAAVEKSENEKGLRGKSAKPLRPKSSVNESASLRVVDLDERDAARVADTGDEHGVSAGLQ